MSSAAIYGQFETYGGICEGLEREVERIMVKNMGGDEDVIHTYIHT